MFVAVAAMLTFTACGGSKPADSSDKDAKVETKEEASASSSNLDEYIKLIEQATPLLEKVSKGDATAMQEYTKIAEKMSEIAMGLQTELAGNPEWLTKYNEAAQKFAEEAAKLAGQ